MPGRFIGGLRAIGCCEVTAFKEIESAEDEVLKLIPVKAKAAGELPSRRHDVAVGWWGRPDLNRGSRGPEPRILDQAGPRPRGQFDLDDIWA